MENEPLIVGGGDITTRGDLALLPTLLVRTITLPFHRATRYPNACAGLLKCRRDFPDVDGNALA